jgi:hypothetical protein
MGRNDKFAVVQIVVALLLIIIFIAAIAGCSASKDKKALGRVLSDEGLVQAVAKTLPPCANDTTVITKVDTLESTFVSYDTAYVTDTLLDIHEKIVTKTVYKDVVRTVTNVVLDVTKVNALNDSLHRYKNLYIQADITERATYKQNTELKKKIRSMYFMGVLIGIVLLVIGRISKRFIGTKFPV